MSSRGVPSSNIGSDGLLGTEALQSCLPHQLDLRTGQLWAEGLSTLQLQQQRLAPKGQTFLKTSVVLPPESEIVAPISVRSPSGIRPGFCSMVEPSGELTEEYGVVVGCMLVDASSWSTGVLMVNPNAEEIVLPTFTFVGDLVPVSAVSVALADSTRLGEECETLPSGRHCRGIAPVFGGCFGTCSIGMNMCFRRRGNRSRGVRGRFSTKY